MSIKEYLSAYNRLTDFEKKELAKKTRRQSELEHLDFMMEIAEESYACKISLFARIKRWIKKKLYN